MEVESKEPLKWALPIKKSAEYIKEYCGIADCHGVESFMAYPSQNIGVLEIRAMSNRHRHAVVYRVRLHDEDAERIRGHLTDEKYSAALTRLKEAAVNGECLLSGGGDVSGSWAQIPNSKLDPWG